MSFTKKDQREILDKLKIEELNQMQIETGKAILEHNEIVLISPTGSGKTLAFLLPIIQELDPGADFTQALILVPSRELAIQIEQVLREMGSGHRAVVVYGGRAGYKDRVDLKVPPTILIGTPGRVADHIRTETVDVGKVTTLVLDEFDKSLEVGFEAEMKEIVLALSSVKKKILTSATKKLAIPKFVEIRNPIELKFQGASKSQLALRTINSGPGKKLETLSDLLSHLGGANGIVFCNFKDTIGTVSEHLQEKGIDHACFFGGMDQKDRERALIKFRNGTHHILIATDLAARGLDIPELDFIIHFEMPKKKDEFIHRNGRTARMNSNGSAYILKGTREDLPDFVKGSVEYIIESNKKPVKNKWCTVYISGGRVDKISKGDIAGLFFKQGNLQKGELGVIEIKQDCAYVAVIAEKAEKVAQQLNNARLKKKKVRMSVLE
jgi:superfamily II DNA/RNA helicase